MTRKKTLQRARRAGYLKETGRFQELSEHQAEDALIRTREVHDSYFRRQTEGRNY